MKRSIGVLIALAAIDPAFADVTAVCKLADDKRTVTVASRVDEGNHRAAIS